MNVLWFRRGLRLHDNPALHQALKDGKSFLALYVFDTTFHAEFRPYHMYGFLLECLADLNESFQKVGTKLHVFRGCPLAIFRHLHASYDLEKIFVIEDCEPIWHQRDTAVKDLCSKLSIKFSEHVAHTLWDSMDIIEANGGTPPLTYDMFLHVAMSLGEPPKPLPDVSWDNVQLVTLDQIESSDFKLFNEIPSLEDAGIPENPPDWRNRRVAGGEKNVLKHMRIRLRAEEAAFKAGFYQPNQARPDLLGPPLSLSAGFALGAVSVRLFYWKVRDLFNKVNRGSLPPMVNITGQLIWREYFYTMGRLNPNYHRMIGNPICLQIPWIDDDGLFEKWKKGVTGYPFIDAGMRQLNQEGWIHHSVRNAVAMFLTRGDLWLDWAKGAGYMANQLVDSDWSVNSGNWMWVSSSAFERLLDCSVCIDSVLYGKRLEPSGDYIRRYVPELSNFEFEYIHEPWKAPVSVQQAANCIIGRDYPERIVIHENVSIRNQKWMKDFRHQIVDKFKKAPPHCQPSSEHEVYQFFCLPDEEK